MAGTSLLTLIDDIATLLDDVAVMSKVAVKKTAGVLGDDLALNAEQVSGVRAERELPVVWAVALGSLKNKAILVPAALLISYFVPSLITPLLMIGGAFLCYEGFEKVYHKLMHANQAAVEKRVLRAQAMTDPSIDLVALEKSKIQGAIRTDFILSAEIIVITLGTIEQSAFTTQIAVLIAVAVLITVGVYGLVAAIVKLDDLGLYLAKDAVDGEAKSIKQRLGETILRIAPYLMRALGVAGTVAMFLVGGGIILHGIPQLGEAVHHLEESFAETSGAIAWVLPIIMEGVTGVLAGGLLVAFFGLFKRVFFKNDAAIAH